MTNYPKNMQAIYIIYTATTDQYLNTITRQKAGQSDMTKDKTQKKCILYL